MLSESQARIDASSGHEEFTVRLLSGSITGADYLGGWEQVLESIEDGVRGPAYTCSTVWAETVAETHLRNARTETLVVNRGSSVEALLPLYWEEGNRIGSPRVLRLVHQVYPGRCGLLVRGNDPALAGLALARLRQSVGGWDVLACRVVTGSQGHRMVIEAARRSGLAMRRLGHNDSPYFDLPPSWPELLASLPKKTRWTIKKGESDLARAGKLEYQEYREPSHVHALLDAVVTIERNSWKERDGSSITSRAWEGAFYQNLLPRIAAAGALSGHVLKLDGAPIAYILGVAEPSGVFLDLKESFDLAQAKLSPGHVLKRFAIERLIERGLRTYDFMGRCEPYKMRWTDKTYRTETLALYNRTARGMVAYWRSWVKARLPGRGDADDGRKGVSDPERPG